MIIYQLKPWLNWNYIIVKLLGWLCTYRKICENNSEKRKVYNGVLRVIFFTFRVPFFAFCILRHSCKKLGFRGLFFRCINKTQNLHEMWKYIVNVSYFVVSWQNLVFFLACLFTFTCKCSSFIESRQGLMVCPCQMLFLQWSNTVFNALSSGLFVF